jgi:hypothetical protein
MQRIAVPNPDHPIARFIREHLGFVNLDTGPWVAGSAARLLYENATDFGYSDIDLFFPPDRREVEDSKFPGKGPYFVMDEPMIVRGLHRPKDAAADYVFPPKDIPEGYVSPMLQGRYEPTPFGGGARLSSMLTGAAVTVQFVTRSRYETADELLNHFDFSACMLLTDGREIIMHDDTAADLAARRLRCPNKPHTPRPFRVAKYLMMGFEPDPSLLSTFYGADGMAISQSVIYLGGPSKDGTWLDDLDEY